MKLKTFFAATDLEKAVIFHDKEAACIRWRKPHRSHLIPSSCEKLEECLFLELNERLNYYCILYGYPLVKGYKANTNVHRRTYLRTEKQKQTFKLAQEKRAEQIKGTPNLNSPYKKLWKTRYRTMYRHSTKGMAACREWEKENPELSVVQRKYAASCVDPVKRRENILRIINTPGHQSKAGLAANNKIHICPTCKNKFRGPNATKHIRNCYAKTHLDFKFKVHSFHGKFNYVIYEELYQSAKLEFLRLFPNVLFDDRKIIPKIKEITNQYITYYPYSGAFSNKQFINELLSTFVINKKMGKSELGRLILEELETEGLYLSISNFKKSFTKHEHLMNFIIDGRDRWKL